MLYSFIYNSFFFSRIQNFTLLKVNQINKMILNITMNIGRDKLYAYRYNILQWCVSRLNNQYIDINIALSIWIKSVYIWKYWIFEKSQDIALFSLCLCQTIHSLHMWLGGSYPYFSYLSSISDCCGPLLANSREICSSSERLAVSLQLFVSLLH